MASGKSPYLEQLILNAVFHGTSITLPTTCYLALSTGAYSSAAVTVPTEVAAGTGYERLAVDRDTGFTAPSGGNPSQLSNVAELLWPTATASWGTVRAVYFVDALTAENIFYGGDLTAVRTVAAGDVLRFAPGQLIFREN